MGSAIATGEDLDTRSNADSVTLQQLQSSLVRLVDLYNASLDHDNVTFVGAYALPGTEGFFSSDGYELFIINQKPGEKSVNRGRMLWGELHTRSYVHRVTGIVNRRHIEFYSDGEGQPKGLDPLLSKQLDPDCTRDDAMDFTYYNANRLTISSNAYYGVSKNTGMVNLLRRSRELLIVPRQELWDLDRNQFTSDEVSHELATIVMLKS